MATQANPQTVDDKKKVTDGQVTSRGLAKEQESARKQEAKIVSEIIQTSREVDERAEKQIKAELTDAKLSTPEPTIPADVAESGVKSPDHEAEEVVKKGATIQVQITESEYKKGLHEKVGGIIKDKVVTGISSIVGLVAWIGRMIKIGHNHTMKVIFKQGGN